MTGPEYHRGGPPVPAPAGWAPDPTGHPGWSATVTGPGAPPMAPGGPSGPGMPGAAGPGMPGVTGPGRAPTRSAPDVARLFGIVIAALGALNFVFGFLPQVTASRIDQSLSVYAVGPGYVPILLLIAGLLALAAFLPGSECSRLAVAAVSVGGAVGALISLGTSSSIEVLTAGQVSKGLGAVLLTIFGIIQAVVAIGAYVVGPDLRVGTRSPAVAERTSGIGNGPAQHGWMAAEPTPTWSAPPPASAPEHTGSVGYYAGYGPVPGSTAGPGASAASTPPMTGWAPPADDDRPTGPQPVVDLGDANRQSPAERELPRAAPGWPDRPAGPAPLAGPAQPVGTAEQAASAQPVGSTWQSGPGPDTWPRHAAGNRTGPAQTPTPAPAQPSRPGPASDGPGEGVTEVYRIPPRTGVDGPPA